MKEIWINFELYFKIYEFFQFLGIFPDFFEFIFDFKSIKTIKIEAKSSLFSHGTHVDATWHARQRGRATRTHASAWVVRCDTCAYLYLFVI